MVLIHDNGSFLRVGHIFQGIPWLAVQDPADLFQRGEPYSPGFVVFQYGKVGRSYPYFFGKLT